MNATDIERVEKMCFSLSKIDAVNTLSRLAGIRSTRRARAYLFSRIMKIRMYDKKIATRLAVVAHDQFAELLAK
jgi:hypothetical protein